MPNMPIRSAIALLLATSTGAAMAQPFPTLTPSTPWAITAARHACTLERSFGSGAEAITLSLTKGLPPLEITVALTGPGTNSDRVGQARTFTFIAAAGAVDGQLYRPSFFSLLDAPPLSARLSSLQTLSGQDIRDLGRQPQVTASLHHADGERLRLTVPEFSAGIAMLDGCQDALYRSLLLDGASLRTIVIDAEPIGETMWVRSMDIPRGTRTAPEGALVTTRLAVDVAGMVTDCTLIERSGVEALDMQTCRLLRARARFRPARNAYDQPVATVAFRKIRWISPD